MFFFQKAIPIFLGSILIGIGVNVFLVPFNLLEGGAIGISLIFHYLFEMKVGLTFLLISIPIFLLAWVFYRSYFYNGIHGMLFASITIDYLYPMHIIGEQWITSPLIGAALGGLFIGTGVGIMFCFDITMGGLDLLAQMLARKLHFNPGVIILCFDIIIVTIGSKLIVSSEILLSFTTIICAGTATSLIVAKSYKTAES